MCFSGSEEIRVSPGRRKLHYHLEGTKAITTSSMYRGRPDSLDDNNTDRFPDDGHRRRVRQRPRPASGETYGQITSPGNISLHSPEITGTGNARPIPLNDRYQVFGIGNSPLDDQTPTKSYDLQHEDTDVPGGDP